MAKYRNAHAIFMLLWDKDMLLTWPDLKIKALLVRITTAFMKSIMIMLQPVVLMMFTSTSHFPFHLGLNWFHISTYHVLINNVTEICKAVLISCIMLKISLLFLWFVFLGKVLILNSWPLWLNLHFLSRYFPELYFCCSEELLGNEWQLIQCCAGLNHLLPE